MTETPLPKNAVWLIDGSGYVFRAYYAIRRLTTSKGQSTNAVFGFTTMLLKVIKEHAPEYLGIAFDVGGKTFRHALDPEYKAHRKPPPEDLPPQIPLIRQLVGHMRIPTLVKEGVEADDVLATMAERAKQAGKDVVIVTGDKDLMQLVDAHTLLLDELRAQKGSSEHAVVDREGVIAKFGVPPEHVVDVLALAGDSSDNIKGVRGIGEKTATELVKEFGSVEEILKAAEHMKPSSKRDKLLADKANALLSKQLVTVKRDVPLDVDLEQLKYQGPDRAALREFFTQMEFRRLVTDAIVTGADDAKPAASAGKAQKAGQGDLFGAPAVEERAAPEPMLAVIDRRDHHIATTPAALAKVAAALGASKRIAVRTEVVGAGARTSLVGVAVSAEPGHAAWLPAKELGVDAIRAALAPMLVDAGKQIVAHDAKTDVNNLFFAGFPTWTIAGDPMLCSYLLDADLETPTASNVARRTLGVLLPDMSELVGSGKNAVSLDQVPTAAAGAFFCDAVDCTLRATDLLEPALAREGLTSLYRDLELPLESVLGEMERAGIKVDADKLKTMSGAFAVELKKLEEKAHAIAGRDFNLASPPQIAELLFKELGLPVTKRTSSGAPSTDLGVLETLADKHELPAVILEHRQLSKLKGTYVDVLPTLLDERGRVHTHFNQAVARTGRLSSSEPNLQNIPVRTELGRQIRSAFVADPGKVLVSLDYSQVELRILAHVTKDPVLVGAFKNNEDVHRRTASEVFHTPFADVTKDQRNAAKAINFGLLYGMGVVRLARELGIKRQEAKTYLDAYHERLAGVRQWQSEQEERAMVDKEVRTLLGRRRKLHGIDSKNGGEVAQAKRFAINTPIQGSAADIMKKAMIDAHAQLRKRVPTAQLLLQVHDELVLEVDERDAALAIDVARAAMVNALVLDVPLVVDGAAGSNWNDAH